MSKEKIIPEEAVVAWSTRNLPLTTYVRMKSMAAVRRVSMETIANIALALGLKQLDKGVEG